MFFWTWRARLIWTEYWNTLVFVLRKACLKERKSELNLKFLILGLMVSLDDCAIDWGNPGVCLAIFLGSILTFRWLLVLTLGFFQWALEECCNLKALIPNTSNAILGYAEVLTHAVLASACLCCFVTLSPFLIVLKDTSKLVSPWDDMVLASLLWIQQPGGSCWSHLAWW